MAEPAPAAPEAQAPGAAAPIAPPAITPEQARAAMDDITTASMTGVYAPGPPAALASEPAPAPAEAAVEPKQEQTPETPAAAPEVAAPETPVAPAPETPAGDTPPVVPETPVAPPPEEPQLSDRVRLSHLAENDKALANAVFALTRTGKSFEEAFAMATGKPYTAPASPAPQVHPEVAAVQSQIDAVEAQMRQKAAAGETGADYAELQIQHGRLSGQLAATQIQASTEAATQATVAQQHQASLAEASAAFPAMKDTTSPLYLVAKALANEAAEKGDPRSQRPDAPMIFVQEAAQKLGVRSISSATPATPQAPAPAPVPPATNTPPPMRPASGGKSTAPAPPAPTPAEAKAALAAMTEAALSGGAIPGPVNSGGRYYIF